MPEIAGFMEDLERRWAWKWQKPSSPRSATIRKLIEGYGKGAIIGAGRQELNSGALLARPRRLCDARHSRQRQSHRGLHQKGWRPRHAARILPITRHINASYVRSHFDSMEIGIADAPNANEILLALVMTTGPRVHARVGGLKGFRNQGTGRLAMKTESVPSPEKAKIRKIVTFVEETRSGDGKAQ